MATTHAENTIRHNYRFLVFMVMSVAMTFAFMVMMFVMLAAFTMFVVIITFATTIVISAATATMSAATLMSKLGINDQHGKQPSADIIEYTQSSMTMTFG